MVTRLPWQPQWYVNNCFVLSHIKSIFHMTDLWYNRHQAHTSLLWQPGYNDNYSDTSITLLSCIILSPCLVWRFVETIGSASLLIAMVTLLPWQPQWNLINSFVLSHIELVVATEVPWNDSYQLHASLLWKFCYHGNQTETSITPLSWVLLSSYLVWRFLGMICISHIHCCYGY